VDPCASVSQGRPGRAEGAGDSRGPVAFRPASGHPDICLGTYGKAARAAKPGVTGPTPPHCASFGHTAGTVGRGMRARAMGRPGRGRRTARHAATGRGSPGARTAPWWRAHTVTVVGGRSARGHGRWVAGTAVNGPRDRGGRCERRISNGRRWPCPPRPAVRTISSLPVFTAPSQPGKGCACVFVMRMFKRVTLDPTHWSATVPRSLGAPHPPFRGAQLCAAAGTPTQRIGAPWLVGCFWVAR
jgi:hypothetical protein